MSEATRAPNPFAVPSAEFRLSAFGTTTNPRTGFDWKTGRPVVPHPPSVPSPPVRPNPPPEEIVHQGIYCDFCGKGSIRGIRYKCVQCDDYNRCSGCMTSPKAWEAHDARHQFFPIQTNDDLSHLTQIVKKQQQSVNRSHPTRHIGITCDGCHKPLEGVRHKCLVCDDYDFCDACISTPSQRQNHIPTHAFFPITAEHGRSLYDAARIQAQVPQGVCHNAVVCDMCGQSPLVGVRHRCLDCNDFDLCGGCVSNPQLRLKHDLSHVFFPITISGDLTLYACAVELRLGRSGPSGSQQTVPLTANISELFSGRSDLGDGNVR
ncbi:hypothetical protein BD310DRAFT_823290 [Dichomitus squalens]|uniref:ZZ-type domain-containing protein n=1 Tax=Dichomitus squalens TaxID=114155 RepID=A0A4Q9PQI7_9APHY|nr:hypothetical protein BD310DRAFT_823290 [Dichomitus squalens]